MLEFRKTLSAVTLLSVSFLAASAQNQEPGAVQAGPNGIFVYHVKAVDRELDAVNYVNRNGSTRIGFKGTDLMPAAKGEAKVESVTGKTKISVNFTGLTPANGFGPEYLTYVLWAISADGRPQNLGELELSGNKANLDISSSYQSFGMIVTAEPYYAVSTPSDVVVLQNNFTDKTFGVLEHVNIHYSLLPKGIYAPTDGAHTIWNPITDREHVPLALYEAHNAARIAQMTGADKYAPDVMKEVITDLKNADDIQSTNHRDVHMEFTDARQATQRAEDARLITLKKQADERQQQAQDAKNAAQAQAAQSQQQAAQSAADAAKAQAQADASAAAKARADAERAKAEADAAAARAQAQAANANAAQSAERLKAEREKLRAQLNAILVTTETARGLVVNLGDVLFDSGKTNLKPEAQIALAKIGTILQLHPDLKVQVEGYTDSVGSDEFNQKLSEGRAAAAHDFLIKNGVPADNVTSQGFGKADPVADNATREGKAKNRRVELVVSGPSIGVATTNHN